MHNNNTIRIGDFRTTLINLHNELGTVERGYNAKAKDSSYTKLHAVLDRYGIGGLKGTLVFDSEEE